MLDASLLGHSAPHYCWYVPGVKTLTGMLPATRSAAAGRTPVREGGVKGSYPKMAIFLSCEAPPGRAGRLHKFETSRPFLHDRLGRQDIRFFELQTITAHTAFRHDSCIYAGRAIILTSTAAPAGSSVRSAGYFYESQNCCSLRQLCEIWTRTNT